MRLIMLLRIIFILMLFASCGRPGWEQPKVITDTVFITKTDTVRIPCDSSYIHALQDSLFVARYKIERVKYYLNIADRSPSQRKFLRGWIRRAVR